MPALWVPPSARRRDPPVRREHREGTRQWEATVKQMMRWGGPVIDHWNPELARIDPLLRLALASENASAAGVRPGFYHLVRLNENAPMWVQPITGPNREFMEPSSAMLDALRMCDLQNTQVVIARQREDELAAKRREREQQAESDDRAREMFERLKAVSRTQILMSPDVRWAQNVTGQRRPTRGRGRE